MSTLWTTGKAPKKTSVVGVVHRRSESGAQITVISVLFRSATMNEGLRRIEQAMKRQAVVVNCKLSDNRAMFPPQFTAEVHLLKVWWEQPPLAAAKQE